METEGISLTKYLSTSGICSRRGAEAVIASGTVSVNGIPAGRGAMRILPGDRVEYQGKIIAPPAEKLYIMLNKPRGYVCTLEDRHAAKKAVDLIPQAKHTRLVSAGRLDKDSEGLILFSNDGDFVAKLTHPRYEVEKTYRVSLSAALSAEAIRQLTGPGIPDAGDILKARAIRPAGQPGHYDFILGEGKNREIRRMAAYFHLEVKRLARIAVGAVRLGALPCGQSRSLAPEEINALFQPASTRSQYGRVSQTAGRTDPASSRNRRRSGGQPGSRPASGVPHRQGAALRDRRARRP